MGSVEECREILKFSLPLHDSVFETSSGREKALNRPARRSLRGLVSHPQGELDAKEKKDASFQKRRTADRDSRNQDAQAVVSRGEEGHEALIHSAVFTRTGQNWKGLIATTARPRFWYGPCGAKTLYRLCGFSRWCPRRWL